MICRAFVSLRAFIRTKVRNAHVCPGDEFRNGRPMAKLKTKHGDGPCFRCDRQASIKIHLFGVSYSSQHYTKLYLLKCQSPRPMSSRSSALFRLFHSIHVHSIACLEDLWRSGQRWHGYDTCLRSESSRLGSLSSLLLLPTSRCRKVMFL